MWSLDDPDVHEPHCEHCLECQHCLAIDGMLEVCEESEDGKHEFVWAGE